MQKSKLQVRSKIPAISLSRFKTLDNGNDTLKTVISKATNTKIIFLLCRRFSTFVMAMKQ
jgi:hypothetical protein